MCVGGGEGRFFEGGASNSELLYLMRLDMMSDRRGEGVLNCQLSSVPPPPTTPLNGTALNEVEYLFAPIFQHYINTIQWVPRARYFFQRSIVRWTIHKSNGTVLGNTSTMCLLLTAGRYALSFGLATQTQKLSISIENPPLIFCKKTPAPWRHNSCLGYHKQWYAQVYTMNSLHQIGKDTYVNINLI